MVQPQKNLIDKKNDEDFLWIWIYSCLSFLFICFLNYKPQKPTDHFR